MNHDPNPEMKFTLLDSRLRGVGGWLAFFIIGQTVIRPVRTFAEFSKSSELASEIQEAFPTTATLITVEKILIIHLIIFGIAVGLALWRVHTPFSVKLTKIYLIANPLVLVLDTLLFYLSDLPPDALATVVGHGFYEAGMVAVWCLIWFLYFVKSERVRVTYLAEKEIQGSSE